MAQAPLIGKWLAAKGYVPQVVLCSDATRTRQTLDRAMSEMPTGVQVFHLAALYLADPRAILDQLYRQTAETITIVGHNPGIGQLAADLARQVERRGNAGDDRGSGNGQQECGNLRDQRIAEFHAFNPQPVVGLREGSWLTSNGSEHILHGPHSARIFRAGQPAIEQPQGPLSF